MAVVEGSPDWKGRPFVSAGGPPDNGGMDARVIKLEEFAHETRDRLARIETKLDNFATKADLAETRADLVKWIVGTAIGLGVAGITVMTFVLNNAVPKAWPIAQPTPQPTIIVVPTASQASASGPK